MGLIVLRFVFVMVASGLAVFILSSGVVPSGRPGIAWVVFLGVLSIALAVIALDIAFRRKHLDTISAVYFGLIVGLFLTYVVGLALTPLFPNPEVGNYAVQIRAASQLVIGAGALLRLHQPVDADQGRFPLHHSLRRVRQGGQGAASPASSTPAW